MKRLFNYYYTTRFEGVKERNNSIPVRTYSWAIRNKKGEILQTSDIDRPQILNSKIEAEMDAEDNIREYYY